MTTDVTSPIAYHPRDLILGTAKGYGWEKTADFVRSWRLHARHARLVLFVDHRMPAADRDRLISLGVELVRLPPVFSERHHRLRRLLHSFHAGPLHRMIGAHAARAPRRLLRLRRVLAEFHHIGCSRYWHYLAYLNSPAGAADRVLLTDVRDVVFQSDPFAATPADRMLCALERATLAGEPVNTRWLDFVYGRQAWSRFESERVSCAGTTLGPAPLIKRYLELVGAEIARLTPRLVGQDGLDQAVHNHVLRTRAELPVTFSDNGAGPIATLHGEDVSRFPSSDAFPLLNLDLRPPAIVHQADRHPALAASLSADVERAHEAAHPPRLVSFIVPTYGRADCLSATLRCALAQQGVEFEIIVVTQDPVPPDFLRELARAQPDMLRVVGQTPANANAARNTALRLARGEIILSIDDDVTFAPDYALRHLAHYDDPTVGFVVSLTRERATISIDDLLALHARDYELPRVPLRGDVVSLRWAPTCSSSFRRSALLKAGWFDPFFTGGVADDTDMAVRVLALGYRGLLDTKIELHHHAALDGGYGTRTAARPMARRLNDQRMRLYFALKNASRIGLADTIRMTTSVFRGVLAISRQESGATGYLLALPRFCAVAGRSIQDVWLRSDNR